MTEQPTQSVQQDPNSRYQITPPDVMGEDFSFSMKAGTEKSLIFEIRNDSGFPGRAQITREVQSAVMADWFPDNAIQEYPVNSLDIIPYNLNIRLPEDAPSGDYAIQLEVVDLALPDETLTRSKPITLRVEPAPDFSIPRWLIALAALIVLAIIGIGIAAYLLSIRQPAGNIWLAYTNDTPSSLHVRLPAEAGTLDDALAQGVSLTDKNSYAQFLNEQAEITQFSEYNPAWSPDGCQVVYGASLEIGRYFMSADETLYDLRSLLSISSADMESLAAHILEYEALNTFLANNPGYRAAAHNSIHNPYLSLAPESTALVSYYQRTLSSLSPLFSEQFYRHVASIFYEQMDRGTLYGLFTLSFEETGEGDNVQVVPRIELVTWARLDSNELYIPANPTWTTSGDRNLIAFEYVQELQRANSPAFIAMDIDGSMYLLRQASLRSENGFYYDRGPAWWSDDTEVGLFFTSRRDMNYDHLRQSQIYSVTINLETLLGNPEARVINDVPLVTIDYSQYTTSTPFPTSNPDVTQVATALPTLTPFPTLFPQVLQYTPVFTLTPFQSEELIAPTEGNVEATAEVSPTAVIVPTQAQLLSLPETQLINISNNSVNDSQVIAIDRDSIIFVSDRDGAQPFESQHLYRLDFGENEEAIPYRLTRDPVSVLEYSASLSDDGENVAYVRQTGRAPQLYYVDILPEIDLDQDPVRITSSSAEFNSDPTWQPAICESAQKYIEARRAQQALQQEASS